MAAGVPICLTVEMNDEEKLEILQRLEEVLVRDSLDATDCEIQIAIEEVLSEMHAMRSRIKDFN